MGDRVRLRYGRFPWPSPIWRTWLPARMARDARDADATRPEGPYEAGQRRQEHWTVTQPATGRRRVHDPDAGQARLYPWWRPAAALSGACWISRGGLVRGLSGDGARQRHRVPCGEAHGQRRTGGRRHNRAPGDACAPVSAADRPRRGCARHERPRQAARGRPHPGAGFCHACRGDPDRGPACRTDGSRHEDQALQGQWRVGIQDQRPGEDHRSRGAARGRVRRAANRA
jgi:hypothetical protein